ncbi:MAG: FkbM family methyltransferase [Terriglobales bacterium]
MATVPWADRRAALEAGPAAWIMDVGMHRGDDTAFFLSKQFHVVGVDANPGFVQANRVRFAAEEAEGRLRIVHAAIAEREGQAQYWAFPGKDVWGTMDPAHAQRNISRGYSCEVLQVPCRRFRDILEECGVPYYLKIDIEGADLLCLRGLAEVPGRPAFVSLELPLESADAAFEPLAQLHGLGYRRFQLMDQALNPSRRCPRPPAEGAYSTMAFNMDMSGLFGRELPGKWEGIEAISRQIQRAVKAECRFGDDRPGHRYGWIRNGIRRARQQWRTPRAWRAALTTTSWYDLHAEY